MRNPSFFICSENIGSYMNLWLKSLGRYGHMRFLDHLAEICISTKLYSVTPFPRSTRTLPS